METVSKLDWETFQAKRELEASPYSYNKPCWMHTILPELDAYWRGFAYNLPMGEQLGAVTRIEADRTGKPLVDTAEYYAAKGRTDLANRAERWAL